MQKSMEVIGPPVARICKWYFIRLFYCSPLLLVSLYFSEEGASTMHYFINGPYGTRGDNIGPPVDNPQLVLIYGYMRGGSSIAGSMLSSIEKSMYWFEPLRNIYMHFDPDLIALHPIAISHYPTGKERNISSIELNKIVDEFSSLFSCNFTRMRPATILTAHHQNELAPDLVKCLQPLRLNFSKCLQVNGSDGCYKNKGKWLSKSLQSGCNDLLTLFSDESSASGQLNIRLNFTREAFNSSIRFLEKRRKCFDKKKLQAGYCIEQWEKRCLASRVRSAKVIRGTIPIVSAMLERFPNMTLIHLLRDPRAIMASRKGTMMSLPFKKEVAILCSKMRRDVGYIERFKIEHPERRIVSLHYEELNSDTNRTIANLFQELNLPDVHRVMETTWRMSHTAKPDTDDIYSIKQNNASKSLSKWKTKLSSKEIDVLNSKCIDLYYKNNITK